jgi:hypothetical protein
MAEIMTEGSPTKTVLWFRARIENGMIIPDEQVSLSPGQTYLVTLQPESTPEINRDSLDALAEIASLAEPLGPSDLARNFDTYTRRVIVDESTN